MSKNRYISADMDGHANVTLSHDEICVVLGEETRVALIKLLGKMSPDNKVALGLTLDEAGLVTRFWHLIQP